MARDTSGVRKGFGKSHNSRDYCKGWDVRRLFLPVYGPAQVWLSPASATMAVHSLVVQSTYLGHPSTPSRSIHNHGERK